MEPPGGFEPPSSCFEDRRSIPWPTGANMVLKGSIDLPSSDYQSDALAIELLEDMVAGTGLEPVSRPNRGLPRYKLGALPLC